MYLLINKRRSDFYGLTLPMGYSMNGHQLHRTTLINGVFYTFETLQPSAPHAHGHMGVTFEDMYHNLH